MERYEAEPETLPETEIPMGSPGRLGSELNEGRPGIELVEGRPGSEPSEGRPGSEPSDGRPGIELAPGRLGRLGPELPGLEGGAGTELAAGTLGSEGADGRPGTEPVDGRLGSEGGVTQTCRPLVLDAVTEPPPPGVVRLPPPDAVTGLGRAGVVGVLTHLVPVGKVGREVGRPGTEVGRPGSEVGSDVGTPGMAGRDEAPGTDGSERPLWLAPLGKTLAAPIAMAATPAAPAVRRMIRP
jgi:hypothetical protein